MFVTLCEYASVSLDGTFTLVRGGIQTLLVRKLPSTLGAVIYVEIGPGELPAGDQGIHLLVVQNKSTVGEARGTLRIGKPDVPARIAFPFIVNAQTPGEYRVRFNVGKLSDDLAITVGVAPATDSEKDTADAPHG